MTKSYAGDKDDNRKVSPGDSAANDAAKKAEKKVEEIKAEAQNEVKKHQQHTK